MQALSNRLMSSGACEVIDLADSDGEPLAFAESRALSMSNITVISFPLGLEPRAWRCGAPTTSRPSTALHDELLAVSSTTENRS